MGEESKEDRILKELQELRRETTTQYRSTMLFTGLAIGFTVMVLGISVWIQVYASLAWQKVDASAFTVLGFLVCMWCFVKHSNLLRLGRTATTVDRGTGDSGSNSAP